MDFWQKVGVTEFGQTWPRTLTCSEPGMLFSVSFESTRKSERVLVFIFWGTFTHSFDFCLISTQTFLFDGLN